MGPGSILFCMRRLPQQEGRRFVSTVTARTGPSLLARHRSPLSLVLLPYHFLRPLRVIKRKKSAYAESPSAHSRKAKIFVNIVGDNRYAELNLPWEQVMSFCKGALLEALARSGMFNYEFRDVDLSDCAVAIEGDRIAPAAAGTQWQFDEDNDSKFVKLELAKTVGAAAIEGGCAGGHLLIVVRLPQRQPAAVAAVAASTTPPRNAQVAFAETMRIRGAEEYAAILEAAMCRTKPVSIEDCCKLLVLPDDSNGRMVCWLGLESNVLFVQPIFRFFYENVFERFRLEPSSRFFRTNMCGFPRIGKSSFGLYVLWRLLNDKRSVRYEYPKGFGKGIAVCFGTGDTEVYIADGCAPSMAGVMTFLISSSPRGNTGNTEDQDSALIDEFSKTAAYQDIMPPLESERHLMARYCFAPVKNAVAAAAEDAHELSSSRIM